MKYLCLRNCFVNGQIYLKGETHELPDDMDKPERQWQPIGGEPDTPEKPREPVHKHYYHKDGKCACGAVLSPAGMKRRELKAKKAKS